MAVSFRLFRRKLFRRSLIFYADTRQFGFFSELNFAAAVRCVEFNVIIIKVTVESRHGGNFTSRAGTRLVFRLGLRTRNRGFVYI